MINKSPLYLALVLLFFCVIYSFKPALSKKPGVTPIRIESGLIEGIKSNNSDVISYKGIPFAAPPVRALRWKKALPAIPWTGVKRADRFGPSPMQPKPVPFMVYTSEFLIPEKEISEDCLYLNVWTKFAGGSKRPVFVWIYGGGFATGGTGVPIYDGEALAKKGIIFVSVNYRVGVFGFLAHPDLSKESPDHVSGNYGLLDQITALQWIKKNIAAFGGDPENITIGGQSAGSMAVNCLVASPVAYSLFQKAIAESGSMLYHPMTQLPEAEQQGIKLSASVHAAKLADLRKTSAEELMKYAYRFQPVVDGWLLPESVSRIFESGKQNNIPLITGWNADENFVMSFKNKEEYDKQAATVYGANAASFLAHYPAATDQEARQSQMKLNRDETFAISGYKWAGIQSRRGKAPVYLYYFARKVPAEGEFIKYGAFHTGEVAYVMNNLKFLNRPWKPADSLLADLMSNYWVNFIMNGNPNGTGLADWPAYTTKDFQTMLFDTSSGKQPLPDQGGLEFMLSNPVKSSGN